MPRQIVCLWFDGQAEAAADLYTTVFRNSKVLDKVSFGEAGPGEPGSTMLVRFEIDGMEYLALNGGAQFRFSPAMSVQMHCATQEEADAYWTALTSEGGSESQCGWLTDRFGVTWQIIPDGVTDLITDPDPGRATRAAQAMYGMQRLDVAAIRAAADS